MSALNKVHAAFFVRLFALLLAGGLWLAGVASACITGPVTGGPGNHQITFIGVKYDYPAPGQSTWYYKVRSVGPPAISHIDFELNDDCMILLDAGTWNGSDQTILTSGGGQPDPGTFPAIPKLQSHSGLTGLKFDRGFNENETRYYYFTLADSHAKADIRVAFKASTQVGIVWIGGPALNCGVIEPKTAKLGDRVWLDLDQDGLQDAGEAGVAGVTVKLLNASSQVVATTVTDADGFYLFTNLTAGTYAVQFVEPAAYLFTRKNADGSGISSSVNSDADPVTGKTAWVSLTAGSDVRYVDAGLFAMNPAIQLIKTASPQRFTAVGNIITYSFTVKNTGNVTLTNVMISDPKVTVVGGPLAMLAAGALDSSTFTATYTITQADLNAGKVDNTASVNARDPKGGSVSDEDSETVTATAPPPATLGDRVWLDTNRNGVQDPGEIGVAGVTVRLLDAGGTSVRQATTNADGLYLFSQLVSGTYRVEFVRPDGHTFSPRQASGNDATDSDADGNTGRTGLITLLPGEVRLTVDAGLFPALADLELTKTALACHEYPATWTVPISKGEQFVDGDYWLRLEYGEPSFDVWGPGNLKSGVRTDAGWHHVVGRFTHGAAAWGPHTLEIFVDGRRVAVRQTTGTTDSSAAPLCLGAYLGNSYFYAGLMDEIRLSRIARSDAWLDATFRQQQAQSAFLNVGSQQAGRLPGYAFSKTLTIPAGQVGETMTNFPVLVRRSDADLAAAVTQAEGYDLVFTLPDGTPLAHEIETFVHASGRLVAWVNLPTVTATTETAFVMHYGNPTVTGPTERPEDVWDGAFAMVQHLNLAVNGKVLDSTANRNDGVIHGAARTPYGAADAAFLFDGKDDKIEIADSAAIRFDRSFTIEGWFSRRTLPGDGGFEICVNNKGPDAAAGAIVTDHLPAGMSVVDYLPAAGAFDPLTATWAPGTLAAGQTASLVLIVNSASPNAVNIAEITACATPDPDSIPGNLVAGEDDLASASLGTPAAVAGVAKEKPDFVVSSITFPSVPAAGTPFTASVTVTNKGKAAGDAGVLNLWSSRSASAAAGTPADAGVTVGFLAAGQSRTLSVTLQAPSQAGAHCFRAMADASNACVEQSEGNNQLTRTYTFANPVSERPDFAVTHVTFVQAPERGGTIRAMVTVRNQGKAPGVPGTLQIWASRIDQATAADRAELTVFLNFPLAIGESFTRAVTVAAPAGLGTHTFRAFVDGLDAVAEQSEGNNQKTRTYGWY